MKKVELITMLMLIVLITSLDAQTVYNPVRGKMKVEHIHQELIIVPDAKDSKANSSDEGAGAAAILPGLIETGISIVKSELKKREESYSAEYSINQSESGFWQDEYTLNLPKLDYKKMFNDDSKALEFILTPHQSKDGLAFRYKLESLMLYCSEARANRRHKSMNLEIDIKFIAFLKGEKEYAKKVLGQNVIKLEGISFDEQISENYYSGWFAIISPISDEVYPNGNYEIELTIKEANPGVLNTQKISKFFKDNGETILKTTKVIIENVFKEDEK